MTDLFANVGDEHRPLADRMRPQDLSEYTGQNHILGEGKPLRRAIEAGRLHSMVFWGPPGTGKTTLARMLAASTNANFIALSAVMAGVKDVREAVAKAREYREAGQGSTVLFLDEVHRFNKAQQDAFLPYVEDGTLVFVGATTENPSFELNNALLSRARVYVLKSLSKDELIEILSQALSSERGFDGRLTATNAQLEVFAEVADGDARRALNLLDIAAELSSDALSDDIVAEVASGKQRRFDKGGDQFYDQISALHKSVRGTDPDAALYWFMRMLDGGADPYYLGRRIIRMASEDIGNADPRGLQLALNAVESYERLGSPEGELALCQAVIYLAAAPKSNAVYVAMKAVQKDVENYGSLDVPMHLRNAPTKLMKELGHGENYRYAHDEPDAVALDENYFPEDMPAGKYYHPAPRGLEIRIGEKLADLEKLRREARTQKTDKTKRR